jgi:ABC-type transport system involved in cytochrome bd biosynthesis fused ATPase/permease subunit
VQTLQQGTALFTGILVLIGTLVIIQLWLLTAALEAFLARSYHVLIPAAASSAVLFVFNALCFGMSSPSTSGSGAREAGRTELSEAFLDRAADVPPDASDQASQSSPNSSCGCGVRIVPLPHARSSAGQNLSHPQQILSGKRGCNVAC